MPTQEDKGTFSRALHEQVAAFIIPNPWDVGTARLLARLGFQALATTSAGYPFSVGRRDSTVGRDEMMAHVGAIASATGLPVSADLEDGYGDDPNTVAETIRLAAAAGLVGCSIEDVTNRAEKPIVYELQLAVERLRAAGEVARSLPFSFMLTGRAENYLVGRARPQGHGQATPSLSGCGGGRTVCAGPHKQRGYCGGGQLRRPPS